MFTGFFGHFHRPVDYIQKKKNFDKKDMFTEERGC
jgi:hypothetical protein